MKLRYIISAFALPLLLSGCVDLDYSEVTTDDEQWVYQSPVYGIQKLVSNVYAHIPNGFDRNYEGGSGATLAAATDEAEVAVSSNSALRFYNGAWSAYNPFSYIWDNSYKAIAEANTFLEKLDKIDLSMYENNNDFEAMKNKFDLFPYEVRFLRAYFYFELVRAYGDVPFTLKSLSVSEANAMEQTSALTIMDWIVAEMDRIAEFLPITYKTELNPEIGRATRMMCLALKARTLLYKASPLYNPQNDSSLWLAAAKANHDVLVHAAEWGVTLGRYADIWGTDNGDGVETIFASKRGSIDSWERFNYPIGVENGQGGMCPTQSLVDAYEYADGSFQTFGERHSAETVNVTETNAYAGLDPRFEMTVVKNGDRWPNYNPYTIETFEGGLNAAPLLNATPTGYYLKKYCDPNVNISTNDASTSRHAWMIMRLGEFYLNFAECAYHVLGDANAKGDFTLSANDAINALRDRSDVQMPHWTADFPDWEERYRRERLVEMAFEDQRFWDVRRWKAGQLIATVQKVSVKQEATGDIVITRKQENRGWNDKYYRFPIPFSEINKNPNLKQNSGWEK